MIQILGRIDRDFFLNPKMSFWMSQATSWTKEIEEKIYQIFSHFI